VAFVARSRFWVVIPELKKPISLRRALALKIKASVGQLGLKLGNLLRLFEVFFLKRPYDAGQGDYQRDRNYGNE
jgi:hypothetical protein